MNNAQWFKFETSWWLSARVQLRSLEEQAALIGAMAAIWQADGLFTGTDAELAVEAAPAICEAEGGTDHVVALLHGLRDRGMLIQDVSGAWSSKQLTEQMADMARTKLHRAAAARRRWAKEVG